MIRIRYRTPFDYAGILRFLEARAIPGVERVIDGSYIRSGEVGRRVSRGLVVCVANEPSASTLVVRHSGGRESTSEVRKRVANVFDVDHDPESMAGDLGEIARVSEIIRSKPGIRVPGVWEPFELCVRAVIGQQISVAAATTFLGRLAERFGKRLDKPTEQVGLLFPTPATIAGADLETIGLTRARSETIRAIARLFEGRMDNSWDQPLSLSLPLLSSVHGIGRWTLGYIAMRGTDDTDAYPFGDLALRKALGPEPVSSKELERTAEQWRPWRAYAAMAIWTDLAGPAEAEEKSRS